MAAAGPNALSKAAAVEVLAYLITAARTQLDEAAEYAPLRLLTAAQRLAGHLAPHASPPVRRVIAALDSMPPTATPRDRDAYTAKVDEICVVLADCLLALHPAVDER
jgi:nitroreductase